MLIFQTKGWIGTFSLFLILVSLVLSSCSNYHQKVSYPLPAPPSPLKMANEPKPKASKKAVSQPSYATQKPDTTQIAKKQAISNMPSPASSLPVSAKKVNPSAIKNSAPKQQVPSPNTIPIVINDKVKSYIRFYTQTPCGRYHFQKTLIQAKEYQTMMQDILQKAGLPKELFYLAFIESGFNNRACSNAHACGPWQFIASTAKTYGLKIDHWVDERLDPVLATKAAAKYLSDLYSQFHDWYLTAAAYNAGDGIIARMVKRFHTRDFWELAKRAPIKKETKNYVPKWLATIIIARNPEKYGFKVPQPQPWHYVSLTTSGLIDICYLAKQTHIKADLLRHLNSALKTCFTPPYRYFIRVPQQKQSLVMAYLKEQEEIRDTFSHFKTYTVKKGDNLLKIARKFRKDVIFLAKLNHLSSPYLLHPSQKLLIPYGEPRKQVFSVKDPKTGRTHLIYTVKSGDSLWKIARHFNTSVKTLKAYNNIEGVLHIGDQLRIPLPTRVITYKVKKGDTLWDIAHKFHVSPKEIMSLNNLNSPIIRPGDCLKIQL